MQLTPFNSKVSIINLSSLIACSGLTILIVVTLLGDFFSPHSPTYQFDKIALPPSWYQTGDISFFLGTDYLGRDILSRLLDGTAYTFGSALLMTTMVTSFGLFLSAIMIFYHNFFTRLLQYCITLILMIPFPLIAIVMHILFAQITLVINNSMLLLLLIPRIVKALYLEMKIKIEKEYVIAARLDGVSRMYLFFYTLLPNIASHLITEIARILSMAIFIIAALGFLGLGMTNTETEWGASVKEALPYFYDAPWIVAAPGGAIFISVLLVNLFAEGLTLAFDDENY